MKHAAALFVAGASLALSHAAAAAPCEAAPDEPSAALAKAMGKDATRAQAKLSAVKGEGAVFGTAVIGGKPRIGVASVRKQGGKRCLGKVVLFDDTLLEVAASHVVDLHAEGSLLEAGGWDEKLKPARPALVLRLGGPSRVDIAVVTLSGDGPVVVWQDTQRFTGADGAGLSIREMKLVKGAAEPSEITTLGESLPGKGDANYMPGPPTRQKYRMGKSGKYELVQN